ncbi:GMC oxidoreductase [Nemania sp. FL0031]|nr:GMC oxidoreductase [Nemania sp. FL0031]
MIFLTLNQLFGEMYAACVIAFLTSYLVKAASLTARDDFMVGCLLGSHFGIPGLPASYDYIVVGGGTAGLTIARRLAENTSLSIAVVEAGDFYDLSNGNYSQVPAYASFFTGNNPTLKNNYLDWYMYTEPQPQLNGRSPLYDSGKVIGGASGRNFLWQIRGTRGCFQKWAEVVNDQTYTLDNMLPYFKRSYHYTPPNNAKRPENSSADYVPDDWDTSGGPVKVSYASWVNSISSWISISLESMGVKKIPSFYGGSLLGWSWLAVTLDPDSQTRSSSVQFLYDVLEKSPNLIIYKSTLRKKILFHNQTAVGVTVSSGGVEYNLTAKREVIISAGVMRSPQLLLASGIGDRERLQRVGVPLIAHRPGVGQNMHDNVLVGPTFQVDLVTHSSLTHPEVLTEAREEYNTKRTGILTNVGGDLAAFEQVTSDMVGEDTLRSLHESFPADWPHLQYLILDAYFGTGNDSSPVPSDGGQYVASSIGLVATFSRGNVTISSPDTAVNPVISPNWLLDPRDQDLAVAAFRRGRQLFSTDAIKPIIISEVYPGSNFSTRDQILNVIRESANSVYNAVGTNKMGKADDPLAVVDSTARVIGVGRLRVVDASIVPFLPPGQPSATVYALAEKIAESIIYGR